MPITGQHALRVEDPKKMDSKSYRTTAGGTLYGGSVKVPTSINIIWAKPVGKSKPSDPPMVQSLRFPTANGWTAEKTKTWLKDNKMDVKGKFEKAADEKEKKSEDTEEFSSKGNVSTYLQAVIHGAFSRSADGLLGNGIISSEQRKAASSSIGEALDEFRSALNSKFPDAIDIKYPRNKEDRTYFAEDELLAIFTGMVESDDMMMHPPMRANEALEMDDIDLGVYVKNMIKKAMARKRMTINVYGDE